MAVDYNDGSVGLVYRRTAISKTMLAWLVMCKSQYQEWVPVLADREPDKQTAPLPQTELSPNLADDTRMQLPLVRWWPNITSDVIWMADIGKVLSELSVSEAQQLHRLFAAVNHREDRTDH